MGKPVTGGGKVLISGVYYPGGGLTHVMEQLAGHLARSFEVVCLGFLPAGTRVPEQPFPGIRFIGTAVPMHGFMVSDPELLRSLIEDEGFGTVLLLGPVHLNRSFIRQLEPFAVRLIAYTCYEGRMKHDYDLADLQGLDRCLFYTHYAYRRYTDLLLTSGDETGAVTRAGFIGHGTDLKDFYPLHADRATRRRLGREQVYPDKHLPDDAFIVLNVNRVYYRKRLDLSLEAFRLFSTDKENVFLHLHPGLSTPFDADTLEQQIVSAGLQDRVFLTWCEGAETLPDRAWLNGLYNACDVGLTTSMGEGWGMGLFEHAATHAPLVAPAHTSFEENWKDAALLAGPCSTQFVFYENADMFAVEPDAVAEALARLYTDPVLYDRVAEACYRRATSPQLTWEKTAGCFAEVIAEVVADRAVGFPLTDESAAADCQGYARRTCGLAE